MLNYALVLNFPLKYQFIELASQGDPLTKGQKKLRTFLFYFTLLNFILPYHPQKGI